MAKRIKNIDELIGKKFGKLMVQNVYRDEKSMILCDCICDCGNTKNGIRYYSLRDGATLSCG